MKVTYDIYKELLGLYVNQMVSNRFRHELNEDERVNIIEKNAQFAERLDELKVPWRMQNAIAYAGTRRENWSKYNHDVVSEVIERCNGTLDRQNDIL